MRDKQAPTKAEFIEALQVLGITGQEDVRTRADVDALVRASYRRLAKETHPDAGGSATRFKAVTAAFETAREFIAAQRFRSEPPTASQFRGATIFVNGKAVGRVEVRYSES